MTPAQIPKTMLILKSSPFGLPVIEVFLRNRGWQLHCTSDLKEALAHLMKNQPHYVLLSVDHANQNVLTLPQLLGPNYPGVVMPFAEFNTSRSFNTLNEVFCEYKVAPPVTGPGIERCVHKYLKDLETSPQLQSAAARPSTLDEGVLYTVKGGLSAGPESSLAEAKSTTTGGLYVDKGNGQWVASNSSETLIARGGQKALEESSTFGDGIITQNIHVHTNVACIVIESPRFAGYLVVVMGKDRQIDDDFIINVKIRLFKFLYENGEEITHDEAMSLKIKQVEFEPWAIECAEFLRKSVHNGDEVAMAFFPRKQVKTLLEVSEDKKMIKIGLDDLHYDRPIEFDLFMYMPTNDKYLLYTPKGSVVYGRQLDRLKKRGVTHMHIHKEAAVQVPKYRAENYLNDLVEEYERAAANPTGPKKAKVPA